MPDRKCPAPITALRQFGTRPISGSSSGVPGRKPAHVRATSASASDGTSDVAKSSSPGHTLARVLLHKPRALFRGPNQDQAIATRHDVPSAVFDHTSKRLCRKLQLHNLSANRHHRAGRSERLKQLRRPRTGSDAHLIETESSLLSSRAGDAISAAIEQQPFDMLRKFHTALQTRCFQCLQVPRIPDLTTFPKQHAGPDSRTQVCHMSLKFIA